jgi:hypothetical protein
MSYGIDECPRAHQVLYDDYRSLFRVQLKQTKNLSERALLVEYCAYELFQLQL